MSIKFISNKTSSLSFLPIYNKVLFNDKTNKNNDIFFYTESNHAFKMCFKYRY